MTNGFQPRQVRVSEEEIRAQIAQLAQKVDQQGKIMETRRYVSPRWLTAIIALIGFLFGGLGWASNYFGVFAPSPNLVHQVQAQRIDNLELRMAQFETLFSGYLVSNCLDTAQVERLRQALVPCNRLINERGVEPRYRKP